MSGALMDLVQQRVEMEIKLAHACAIIQHLCMADLHASEIQVKHKTAI